MKLFNHDLKRSNQRLKLAFWALFATGALFFAYDLFIDIRANVGSLYIVA